MRRYTSFNEYDDLHRYTKCQWCDEIVEMDKPGWWRFGESRRRGRQCNECRREEIVRWLKQKEGTI